VLGVKAASASFSLAGLQVKRETRSNHDLQIVP